MGKVVPLHMHGTDRRYRQGCRCDYCRNAHRVAMQKWREKARKAPSDRIPHGTEGGYTNYKCKCDSCKRVGLRARGFRRLARLTKQTKQKEPNK